MINTTFYIRSFSWLSSLYHTNLHLHSELQRLRSVGGVKGSTLQRLRQDIGSQRQMYEQDKEQRTNEYKKAKQDVMRKANLKSNANNRMRRGRMKTGTSNEYWR